MAHVPNYVLPLPVAEAAVLLAALPPQFVRNGVVAAPREQRLYIRRDEPARAVAPRAGGCSCHRKNCDCALPATATAADGRRVKSH
jgi:hypothetical protein